LRSEYPYLKNTDLQAPHKYSHNLRAQLTDEWTLVHVTLKF
jgi:hypothetical protein